MIRYLSQKNHGSIPIKPPVTVDGTVDENFVTCPKCNQQIRMSELFEHEDYHVAKDMKRKLRSIGHQVTRKKQKATKKKDIEWANIYRWFSSWKNS